MLHYKTYIHNSSKETFRAANKLLECVVKMIRDDKGNPIRIHSLGKFEEPNARFGFSLQINSEEGEVFDKKQIALAIRNSTFSDELRCSLFDDGILDKCQGCSLKYICDEIEKVVDNYEDKTTEVVNNFNFE